MSTDDVRDQVDGEQRATQEKPDRDPAENFELVANDPEDPEQWTLSETDVTDFYTEERWLTVTDEQMVLPLEGCR